MINNQRRQGIMQVAKNTTEVAIASPSIPVLEAHLAHRGVACATGC